METELIKKVRELLSSPDGEEWGKYYAIDLETLREPLLSLRVERWQTLCQKREQARMPNYRPDPKDKETPRYTDFDRHIMLNEAVAEYEAEYELVAGLEKLVAERVDLIKLLMRINDARRMLHLS